MLSAVIYYVFLLRFRFFCIFLKLLFQICPGDVTLQFGRRRGARFIKFAPNSQRQTSDLTGNKSTTTRPKKDAPPVRVLAVWLQMFTLQRCPVFHYTASVMGFPPGTNHPNWSQIFWIKNCKNYKLSPKTKVISRRIDFNCYFFFRSEINKI